MTKIKHWSKEEDDYLRINLNNMSNKQIAQNLNRSIPFI